MIFEAKNYIKVYQLPTDNMFRFFFDKILASLFVKTPYNLREKTAVKTISKL